MVFAQEGNGIFFVDQTNRVIRISDTQGSSFRDTLPAVSHDAKKIAWVRQDLDQKIGTSGFVETFIVLANNDGSGQTRVSPSPGVIQDAPAFEPLAGGTRLAWSEFRAESVGAGGPTEYGVRIHDFRQKTDQFACQGELSIPGRARKYRCFGQHLVWPCEDVLILTQDFAEIYLDTRSPTTIYPAITSAAIAQLGDPDLRENPAGFYPAFPISASYTSCSGRLVFDGVMTTITGNSPSLRFFVADVDGGALFPLNIQNHSSDYDTQKTANFLFSVATPQQVP